jgi:hypothetical protein
MQEVIDSKGPQVLRMQELDIRGKGGTNHILRERAQLEVAFYRKHMYFHLPDRISPSAFLPLQDSPIYILPARPNTTPLSSYATTLNLSLILRYL